MRKAEEYSVMRMAVLTATTARPRNRGPLMEPWHVNPVGGVCSRLSIPNHKQQVFGCQQRLNWFLPPIRSVEPWLHGLSRTMVAHQSPATRSIGGLPADRKPYWLPSAAKQTPSIS